MWPDKKEFGPNHIPSQEDLAVAIKSPHSQAWAIPEESSVRGFPLSLTEQQLLSTILMIWREYMHHEEVLSAIQFLENAPYRIRDHHDVLEALALTRLSIKWMENDAQAQDINTPKVGDSFINDEMIPLSQPLTAQLGVRYNWVTSKLPFPNTDFSIIDFGSLDGVMTNRWGKLGAKKVVGLDLSEISVRVANQKAAEHNTGAVHYCTYFRDATKHVEPSSFDFASCCDVYEHLVDPVRDLLIPVHSVLKEGGLFMTTTPWGSWMRGNIIQWAYPWRICDKEDWLIQNRAHLVAPSVWSMAKHLNQAGFRIRTCIVIKHNGDVPDQGNVVTESIKTSKQNNRRFCVIDENDIDGAHLESLFQYSNTGANIQFYSPRPNEAEGIFGFIECRDIQKAKYIECDVLIANDPHSTIKYDVCYDTSILGSPKMDEIFK
jgi:2-polyprenyl-3-methyl-5-hydroxy-6-metoxy-1,4-benzoquinol methylase